MTTTYTASNALPLGVLPTTNGILQNFKVTVANSGSATYAPDGLAAAPIFGPGGQALQGNEIVANGIVTLTSYVGPLLNSGALCWILSACSGGELQVAAATQSQHAVQFAQVSGVVGQVRNLAMSVATASASATLTADEIIVETALGGLRYCLANFSKTINLATTGVGGMDTGTAPVSGYVALYAIYNPTTATAALLATNAATKQGNVYGGANMPAGYTASALIAVWPTTGSSQFLVGSQLDRQFRRQLVQVFNTTSTPGSATAFSISAAVPSNARAVSGCICQTSTVSTTITFNLASDAALSGSQIFGGYILAGGGLWDGFSAFTLPTAQTLYYTAGVSAGTATFQVFISGYDI